jgi:hypothetical protein
VGHAVGDVALANVSTTDRHAQRTDIMDTLRPLQRIGGLRAMAGRGPADRSLRVIDILGFSCQQCPWAAAPVVLGVRRLVPAPGR